MSPQIWKPRRPTSQTNTGPSAPGSRPPSQSSARGIGAVRPEDDRADNDLPWRALGRPGCSDGVAFLAGRGPVGPAGWRNGSEGCCEDGDETEAHGGHGGCSPVLVSARADGTPISITGSGHGGQGPPAKGMSRPAPVPTGHRARRELPPPAGAAAGALG